MTDISIIVPIYNSERWLRKCIESLISQSWKNLEIILINDGSTDASTEICQYYAGLDERIVYISQLNQGMSVARNTGFDVATGDYVYFLDSDDYVAKNLVESCMKLIIKERYDILTFDTMLSDSGENSARYARNIPANKLLQASELLNLNIEKQEWRPTVWLYVYKRSFLLNEKIRFIEGIMYEDNEFSYRVLTRRATCIYLPHKLHIHIIHDESSTGQKPTSKNINAILIVLKEMINIHSELGNPREHLKLLRMYAWMPLKIFLEGPIFDRGLLAKYISILIKNPNLFSTSVLKEIVKFIIRLGRPVNNRF
ncbi:glycosyltransferase [Amylibacter sp.]|jgi:glycosyltransferase involved in cell wall biosynthesis|nr:glycosyltransferase [Amylibacter sp.]MDC1532074.1 glycosyltransferase [Amylibacter sp.]